MMIGEGGDVRVLVIRMKGEGDIEKEADRVVILIRGGIVKKGKLIGKEVRVLSRVIKGEEREKNRNRESLIRSWII